MMKFKSKRKIYCWNCKKITLFVYNPKLKHSMCVICENSFKKEPKHMPTETLKIHKEIYENLR